MQIREDGGKVARQIGKRMWDAREKVTYPSSPTAYIDRVPSFSIPVLALPTRLFTVHSAEPQWRVGRGTEFSGRSAFHICQLASIKTGKNTHRPLRSHTQPKAPRQALSYYLHLAERARAVHQLSPPHSVAPLLAAKPALKLKRLPPRNIKRKTCPGLFDIDDASPACLSFVSSIKCTGGCPSTSAREGGKKGEKQRGEAVMRWQMSTEVRTTEA